MPVYNGEPYLGIAIESILNQTSADFELVICDNASTDATADICHSYASQDDRIRYFRNERNLGAAANYNLAFERSIAPYFRWANADDISGPDLHARCLEILDSDPGVVLAYGKTEIIDGDGAVTSAYDDNLALNDPQASDRYRRFFERIGLSNVLYGLMRRSALVRTGLMGDGRAPAADISLIAELTLYGRFVEIPQVLFYRRMHQAASSWDRSDQAAQRQFWTASASKFVLPTWRTALNQFRGVLRSPVPAPEKLRLVGYLARRLTWQRRDLAMDLFHLLRPTSQN